MNSTSTDSSILALDVGTLRIGVARAILSIALASPLTWLPNDDTFISALKALIDEYSVTRLVVGLPRNLSGDDTQQTKAVRQFVANLSGQINVPIIWQDEALTSQKAEAELAARGKQYEKGDIDALAACYILDDYLTTLTQEVQ